MWSKYEEACSLTSLNDLRGRLKGIGRKAGPLRASNGCSCPLSTLDWNTVGWRQARNSVRTSHYQSLQQVLSHAQCIVRPYYHVPGTDTDLPYLACYSCIKLSYLLTRGKQSVL